MALTTDVSSSSPQAKRAGPPQLGPALKKAARVTETLGLGWLAPLLSLAAGEPSKSELPKLWERLGLPCLALALFALAWASLAPQVQTSLGAIPGPVQVAEQAGALLQEHAVERQRAREFYARQEARNAAIRAQNPDAEVRTRAYTGRPTFIDQILTSLKTVFLGFVLASLVAIPLGVACGLSRSLNAALNPIVQILKPVSPLAWLPIVTMVVSALVAGDDPSLPKSMINSAVTVTLCSLWPTLINTSVGVASIDKDLLNVGRVLRLGAMTKIIRLVLPSALPYIFTGLRLSLGVGWMVLIAAEMLAQNPGLGKFVWDEFQNGSSASLARIMVAVLTIGFIGFLLDRLMLTLQTAFAPQQSH
ncbi:MAG: ABC transporter permease [Hydrogenophilaceae bacterium]|nr:ABC transporter permease [Hydrogenophilaceae bacterium]